MENLSDYIPNRPEEQHVWVVRASSGQYVEHFRRFSLMAIGHLNNIKIQKGSVTPEYLSSLENLMTRAEPERPRSSITSHANQARIFASEIKINDLVVTLDSSSLMIGRVSGDVYIDDKTLSIETSKGRTSDLDFYLRRPVKWGPRMRRKDVPNALEMTLLAHQTVFNLDSHWEAVYHLIYPFFFHQDEFYLSTNIAHQNRLNNFSIAQLFALLSGIEVMAVLLSKDTPITNIDYGKLYTEYIATNRLTLTSQAEFMSPGTIWSRLKITPKGMACAALIYAMLFGAKTPLIETDGIIDKDLRHKIFELVVQMKSQHQLQQMQQDLEIAVPAFNTEALKQTNLCAKT